MEKKSTNRVQALIDSSGSYFLLHEGTARPIRIDIDFESRKDIGTKNDLLAKAVGYKKSLAPSQYILDLTAGLCRDSVHLAALGFRVEALEKNKILFDALNINLSKLDSKLSNNKTKLSLKLIFAEATQLLRQWLNNQDKVNHNENQNDNGKNDDSENQKNSFPNIIYYDPMFPEKKKSAKAGKESQLLQVLETGSSPEEESEVVRLALQVARNRVVVKRPLGAPAIATGLNAYKKPTAIIKGKAVRYDVYVVHKV